MFENPRRGRQARNFTTNAPKILDLKSSSEQIFSRKLPLGAPDHCKEIHKSILNFSGEPYNLKNINLFLRSLLLLKTKKWSAENFKKMCNLDELAPEPTKRSCDTGQLIPCFDSCQLLTIIWMSIIKLNTRYRPPHSLERLTFHIIGFPAVRTDGQTHSHMITKISQVDRLPNFHGHGARACMRLHC